MVCKRISQEFNQEEIDDQISGIITPSTFEYLERIESRKIYLFGDIETNNILHVIYQIHNLESKSNEDIEIIINSYGGYVVDCFALIDVMDASKCDFRVVVLGMAASAACLIASNGTPGKRYAGKNSEFMFHEVMSSMPMETRQSDMPMLLKDTKRVQDRFTKIFSKNTGRSKEEIKDKFYGLTQDVYMTANQSKEFGIIDKIVRGKR